LRTFSIPVLKGFALALETRRASTAILGTLLLLANGLFGSPPFGEPGETDLEVQAKWVGERVRWERSLAGVLTRDVTVDIHNIGGRRASAIFAITSSMFTGVVVEIFAGAALRGLVSINHRRAGTATTTATAILRG
jgi:hypothetical protein